MLATQYIYFVLTSRFPTEKAYGVTTEFSARALEKLGYNVSIIAPVKGKTRDSNLKVEIIASRLFNILLSRKLINFLKLRFNIFLLLYVFFMRKNLTTSNNIFWCRDIFLCFLLSLKSKSYLVCEIHRSPTSMHKFFLFILARKRNVILAPIANFLSDQYSLSPSRTVYAPMAINSEELVFLDRFLLSKQNKIVYVGLPHQVGIPLNVNLINNVAIKILNTHPNWTFELLGISHAHLESHVLSPIAKNLTARGFVSRNQVIEALGTASIGLVIYPDIPWFRDSFPIKIIEYAAASLAILASDTTSHRRILDNNRCIFFDENSLNSLNSALEKIISDRELRQATARNARVWANDYTYEKRVKSIIEVLKLNISK